MDTFFELGKAKEAKKRDGLRLSSAVPKMQWDYNPYCPQWLLGYGIPFNGAPMQSLESWRQCSSGLKPALIRDHQKGLSKDLLPFLYDKDISVIRNYTQVYDSREKGSEKQLELCKGVFSCYF